MKLFMKNKYKIIIELAKLFTLSIVVLFLLFCGCAPKNNTYIDSETIIDEPSFDDSLVDDSFVADSFVADSSYQNIPLVNVLESLVDHSIIYDPAYVTIPYPNGDIDPKRGVCTDVVIRAYRKIEIDLQKEVHEDMTAHFDQYPTRWGLRAPNANIDHRRVPNLMTFFSRHGTVLEITNNKNDYTPGNIVCWDLGGGILHIGIVTNVKQQGSFGSGAFMVLHNIGAGQRFEDCLFSWSIIGHYRY